MLLQLFYESLIYYGWSVGKWNPIDTLSIGYAQYVRKCQNSNYSFKIFVGALCEFKVSFGSDTLNNACYVFVQDASPWRYYVAF